MYTHILIPLDNSPVDETILNHVRSLAKLTGARLTLIHVADGYGARLQEQLNLEDSQEMKDDRLYLENRCAELHREGYTVRMILAVGDPSKEIIATAENEHCDLIAMSTHGHGLLKDIVLGSVANGIRHQTNIPILMIRAAP